MLKYHQQELVDIENEAVESFQVYSKQYLYWGLLLEMVGVESMQMVVEDEEDVLDYIDNSLKI
jgi:hypothetical protein